MPEAFTIDVGARLQLNPDKRLVRPFEDKVNFSLLAVTVAAEPVALSLRFS